MMDPYMFGPVLAVMLLTPSYGPVYMRGDCRSSARLTSRRTRSRQPLVRGARRPGVEAVRHPEEPVRDAGAVLRAGALPVRHRRAAGRFAAARCARVQGGGSAHGPRRAPTVSRSSAKARQICAESMPNSCAPWRWWARRSRRSRHRWLSMRVPMPAGHSRASTRRRWTRWRPSAANSRASSFVAGLRARASAAGSGPSVSRSRRHTRSPAKAREAWSACSASSRRRSGAKGDGGNGAALEEGVMDALVQQVATGPGANHRREPQGVGFEVQGRSPRSSSRRVRPRRTCVRAGPGAGRAGGRAAVPGAACLPSMGADRLRSGRRPPSEGAGQ